MEWVGGLFVLLVVAFFGLTINAWGLGAKAKAAGKTYTEVWK